MQNISSIQKSQTWLRIILLVSGVIVISLSVYRISNLANTASSFLEHLSISLIVVGITNIIRGISNKEDPKVARVFVGIGILAIIGGLYSVVHPIQEPITTIHLVSLFIIAFGAGLVITGFTSSQKTKADRIARISIGIIIMMLTGVLELDSELPLIMLVFFTSINMLITGLEIIIAGVTGQKIARKS